MAIIRKKTKKAITKQVKKLVKKHGPEIALGAATALVGSVVAAVTSRETKGAKKKSVSDKAKKKETGKKKTAKASAPEKTVKKKTQKDEDKDQK